MRFLIVVKFFRYVFVCIVVGIYDLVQYVENIFHLR